ncbi:MAG: tRNA (guanosine(46)-N7)-methyltransferase TrmB [Anaerolineae bacterium]|nr:tRNA (guanosine(46)-N7)-methyltransferase TrmB [Anaerolineae bacterium]
MTSQTGNRLKHSAAKRRPQTNRAEPQKLNAVSLPWPADWAQIFGAERPLILEIGFGTGVFLRHLAQQHPESNIIGLEISNQCLLKAENMIAREGFNNLRVIHSRAETALHHLFEPTTLSQVVINFPDPWFKRDHVHRRLMQRDTLNAIVSRMRPGAMLYLATDILAYAEMAGELLNTTPGLTNTLPSTWANTLPDRVITKYEAKARSEGRDCMYFAYQRNHQPAPDVPIIGEIAMPHIVFQSPLSQDEIRVGFAPFDAHEGDIYVGFGEVYRGRSGLLFEIHAAEPTIDQHAALLLTPHGQGQNEYTIQLSTIGHPRPTQGIHLAVNALHQWIAGLSENTTVIQRKLAE